MAFPTSPTNGQITIVGGVAYQYATTTNSWGRIVSTANVITANVITVDTLTANTLNVNNNLYNIAGNISATGNITGNYILGNGSQLTGIATGSISNITSGTSNITIASSGGNATVNIGGTADVAVFAVTGEYVTGVVSASGNVTGGNLLTGGLISATGALSVTGATTLTTVSTGNISAGNVYSGGSITTGSLISAVGNVTGGNVVTGGLISATGNVASGASINTVNLSVSGNVLGNLLPSANVTYDLGSPSQMWRTIYVSGNTIVLGTANLSVSNGNLSVGDNPVVTVSPTGTSNATGNMNVIGNITGSNITTAGLISAASNITGGNILTGGLISVTGNVTAGNVSATNFTGLASSATLAASANAVAGANVSGQVANALVAGTVYTAAQPNITSVGTLTSLSVTGNVTGGNILTGGLISATGSVYGIELWATQSSGDEGGQLNLANPVSNSTIAGSSVTVDIFQNKFRIFEQGGTARGAFIDITACGAGVSTNLLAGGGGGGITWTTVANTAPSNAAPGDFWYNSYSDIKYQYTNDGTGNFWVDQSYPTSFSTLAVTGNITGGNISVTSIVGTLTTAAQPNITSVGTLTSVTTSGVITVNSGAAATAIVNGAGNAVGNIGSSGTYFNRLFAQATTALYADLAEVYKSDAEYPPGTVLVFGGSQEVTISTQSHDTRIAGVVSTNPAHVMNSGLVSEYTVDVGLIGRVPCQVIGPIAAGDQVVSSNRAGVAERLDMRYYQPGVIIGKAVESYNSTDVGTIEIVVGRL
jgi:hypothetical protein